ncbi:ribonuclease III [Desulfovibrio sp. OttesenSCG-928-C06]|nr:ribonuclease III [Desulfovibrio sp. OttesenSCG-928-C06]
MLENLQLDIHYTFKQVKHLSTALTHSSYVNEEPGASAHNERLEFLGDAVLELCISKVLFNAYPEAREGELTAMRSNLVSQTALAAVARQLKIDSYLMLGRGEEAQGGRQRDALLSDALEAVFGAVFVDGGFEAAERVIGGLVDKELSQLREKLKTKDSKSLLQELSQKLFQDRPLYILAGSDGPEHAKIFNVRMTLPDGREYEASGPSVKRAEQAVAALALAELEK